MNNHDINSLKNLDTPEPSENAKKRAVNAALMAFDAAEKTEKQKSFRKNYQGIPSPIRLMTSFLQMTGEWIMRRSLMAGTAVALVLTAPVALITFSLGYYYAKDKAESIVDTSTIKQTEKEASKKTTKADTSKNEIQVFSTENKPVSVYNTKPSSGRNRSGVVMRKPAPQRLMIMPNPKTINPAVSVLSRSERRARSGLKYRRVTQGTPMVTHLDKRHDRRSIHYSNSEINGIKKLTTRDRYPEFKPNPVTPVRDKPVSTFSIDVDTASYALMRRALNQGRMPNPQSIRVEELINYFTYNYQLPEDPERPFKATTSVFESPWNKHKKLLHIGIKGHDIVKKDKPRSNLVFLIDVSGSMGSRDKLPLLKSAFKLLVNKLEPEDTVAIVTYAGRSATVLKPTEVAEKQKILEALDNLQSGGSTAGAQGIQQAYKLAKQNFDKEGVNRVILATDGDFNVGMSSDDELKTYIETQRKSGIFLSVLGFGQGNYNDSLMQVLAQNGNGTAAYIDSLKEAQKVLVNEAGSTLFTIAKDVKIQIEFNPAKVAEYRLIGYETRALKREDFNNDKVDAGDIGSGHAVTAIYEITPVGSPAQSVDDLRYAANKNEQDKKREAAANTNEYAFLKLRYKLPKESKSKLIRIPVTTEQDKTLDTLSDDTRFATAVAAFGQKIKGNQHLSDFTYDQIHKLASNARGNDTYGYRSEFLSLIRLAKSIGKISE